MKANPYDLFGEIPVTTDDVAFWLRCVPRMDPSSPRARWYIKGWNVVEKIRQAKRDGTWESLQMPRNDDALRWAFL